MSEDVKYYKKIRVGFRVWYGGGQAAVFIKVVRQLQEGSFGHKLVFSECVSHVGIQENKPSTGESQCKGPVVKGTMV